MTQLPEQGHQMTSVDAYVHHHIPGRVRFRVPAAKGEEQRLRELSSAIAKVPGVNSVDYNPVTGSILIEYSPGEYRDLGSLDKSLNESGIPIEVKQRSVQQDDVSPSRNGRHHHPHHRKSHAAKVVDSFFRELDHDIRTATGNEVDLKFVMPLVVGVLGLISLRRTATTPLWLTLMIFAFHSFMNLHAPGVEDIAEADRIAMEMEG
jgi:copper chaperone CopZ